MHTDEPFRLRTPTNFVSFDEDTIELRNRFSVRGMEKVRGEWHLACLALNIKRMRGLVAC